MTLEVKQKATLPRLLDLDPTPSISRRRWYWRYVQSWRRRLFYLWRKDNPRKSDKAEIARGVDDLLAIALLLDYFHRAGHGDLPLISNVHECLTHPSVSDITSAIAATIPDTIAHAIFDSRYYTSNLPVPRCVVDDNWQHRLGDATWMLYRDGMIPLSLFGDFHQVCTGNPLNAKSNAAEGKGKRRARGMFYTPAPIVDYLVATTLAPILADRSPEELLKLRILDPSCGCGAFMIATFRYISSWFRQHPDCDTRLASQFSLQLIERVLHGCDVDSQAVDWTIRLELLAAREMLRNRADQNIESAQLIQSLQNMIRCRSFLEPAPPQHSISSRTLYDVVLGGPPFVRLEHLHRTQQDQLLSYRRRYLSARQGQYDLYMLFIEQALDLLKEDGRVAFSLSNSFMRTDSGRIVRGYISANASVEEIVEFDDPRTYDDAVAQIALLRLRKIRPRCSGRYAVIKKRGRLRHKLERLAAGQPHSEISIESLVPEATTSSRWKLSASDDSRWLENIQQAGVPLGCLVTIEFGLNTCLDRLLLLKEMGRTSEECMFVQSREDKKHTIRLEEEATRSVARGHQLRGYQPPRLRHVYPFPYDVAGRALSEYELRNAFPLMHAYLLRKQHELSKRDLAKGCPWFSTFCRRPKRFARNPRLMSAKITSGGKFSLIENPQLLAHNSVVVVTDHSGSLDPYYLLGILNSKVFSRYISLTMPKINEGRYSLRLSRLRCFPTPDPGCENVQQASQTISSLVHDLLRKSHRRQLSQELLTSIDCQLADLYQVIQ